MKEELQDSDGPLRVEIEEVELPRKTLRDARALVRQAQERLTFERVTPVVVARKTPVGPATRTPRGEGGSTRSAAHSVPARHELGRHLDRKTFCPRVSHGEREKEPPRLQGRESAFPRSSRRRDLRETLAWVPGRPVTDFGRGRPNPSAGSRQVPPLLQEWREDWRTDRGGWVVYRGGGSTRPFGDYGPAHHERVRGGGCSKDGRVGDDAPAKEAGAARRSRAEDGRVRDPPLRMRERMGV